MNRKDELAHNLEAILLQIPETVTLIAVTKTYPISDVELLKECGINNFGENRVSELEEKAGAVDAKWHFQGQIQSNKIKTIAHYADVIHSLDDGDHIDKFDRHLTRSIDAFIQVSLDGAINRGGVEPAHLNMIAMRVQESNHLNLVGLMAVAPLGENPDSAFSRLATLHGEFLKDFPLATSLSAGMSNDFQSALRHGATHIRIGSQILGSRHPLG